MSLTSYFQYLSLISSIFIEGFAFFFVFLLFLIFSTSSASFKIFLFYIFNYAGCVLRRCFSNIVYISFSYQLFKFRSSLLSLQYLSIYFREFLVFVKVVCRLGLKFLKIATAPEHICRIFQAWIRKRKLFSRLSMFAKM